MCVPHNDTGRGGRGTGVEMCAEHRTHPAGGSAAPAGTALRVLDISSAPLVKNKGTVLFLQLGAHFPFQAGAGDIGFVV